jgi:hypothetical protein
MIIMKVINIKYGIPKYFQGKPGFNGTPGFNGSPGHKQQYSRVEKS